MQPRNSQAGFTLMELLVATAIGLVVIGTAMTTFKDALGMTNVATNLADASQNLRGGTNLIVRDLAEAGRGIPTGGIPVPNGVGVGPLNRPSPPGLAYTFDNVNATTLTAIVTGGSKGQVVDGRATDMVTLLTIDPILDTALNGALQVQPFNTAGAVPKLAQDGSSLSVTPNEQTWIAGNPADARPAIAKGDLLMFVDVSGNAAIQTVTRVDPTTVYFDSNADDPFSFNQRNATAGSITQILGQTLNVQRVIMYTYYVDPGVLPNRVPRLMRQYNSGTPQALAGVVEDLELSYDLVDGSVNPTAKRDLPITLNGATYSPNQIRKANVHIGVRSETMSTKTQDYLRSHISTVVSLRNLAFVDRYK
jgi:prepilin-type N-terminal cleavage/methylation domain-containing protein